MFLLNKMIHILYNKNLEKSMYGVRQMVEKNNIKDIEITREEQKKNKLVIMKDNTARSLKEVEFFLGNWKRVLKGIKLYKILK